MKDFAKIILLCGLFLIGCSYYGTDTYLKPVNKTNIICSGIEIEIYPILIDRDKKAHAFAGIPYFPSILKSSPSAIGEIRLWFTNIKNYKIGSFDDIYLYNKTTEQTLKARDIWKSKVVEQKGIRYFGCVYKFGNINGSDVYEIHFNETFLNCNIEPVPLVKQLSKGYHPVLLQ